MKATSVGHCPLSSCQGSNSNSQLSSSQAQGESQTLRAALRVAVAVLDSTLNCGFLFLSRETSAHLNSRFFYRRH